jgi:MarR family transcriptional regulator, organic hydroperoxide resistance regulator
MTSQVLRTLEKKGLIERQKREGDERSKFPHLTKQGAKLVEQAIPLVESIDQAFFAKLGTGVGKCIEILKKLA